MKMNGFSGRDKQVLDKPILSVVVCTYNRDERLKAVLGNLCEQLIQESEYEIIIVDNNSNDNTHAVGEEFCRNHRNVRYCFEAKQGLAHARNRGLQEARGQYVGYTDDDCKVPKQWLVVAKEIIEQISPGVFGGPYFAYYNTPKPRWFKKSYDTYYSYNNGEKARCLTPNEYLSGGNMFFRRALLEELNGFDCKLGMLGNRIGLGEETALQELMRAAMPNQLIYYEPRLYVYHLVPAMKMTILWTARYRFMSGRYSQRIFHIHNWYKGDRHRLLKRAAFTLLTLGVDLAHAIILRDYTQYPYIQNYLYERTLYHFGTMGMVYEQYRQMLQESNSNRAFK